MRTVIVVQARLESTRLPRKVTADIGGLPMLTHVMNRACAVQGVDEVVVAAPHADGEELARHTDCRVITGDPTDVLSRYVAATLQTGADRVVRLTADCPLLDPFAVEKVLALQDKTQAPYVSNVWPERTWPDGLDTEVFTRVALAAAQYGAKTPEAREHVTARMRHMGAPCVLNAVDLGRLKWSVDTFDELAFVRAVVDHLPAGGYSMFDTMAAINEAGLWGAQPESNDWRRMREVP